MWAGLVPCFSMHTFISWSLSRVQIWPEQKAEEHRKFRQVGDRPPWWPSQLKWPLPSSGWTVAELDLLEPAVRTIKEKQDAKALLRLSAPMDTSSSDTPSAETQKTGKHVGGGDSEASASGLARIRNTGTDCFLAVVIQLLFAIPTVVAVLSALL
jgi:hypothetical protein